MGEQTIFSDIETNEYANRIIRFANETLWVLEYAEYLMPSNQNKTDIDEIRYARFKEVSQNSISFINKYLVYLMNDLKHIRGHVEEGNEHYINLSDGCVITICKILQFPLGKISWYVTQPSSEKNYTESINYKKQIKDINQIVDVLKAFDYSYIGKSELSKINFTILKLEKNLGSKSIFKTLGNLFFKK